ncbi:MAG: type II secretion system F family protein [Candidatus Omnitrophota bacterium]
MPKYNYIAKTKDAKTIRDVETAMSKEEIISRLRVRGLFIVSITEVREQQEASFLTFFSSRRKGKRNSVKLYDLAFLARNLATTLSSGVTLLHSLEVISAETESARLSKVLKECADHIKSGLSFREAIAKYPAFFSPLWRAVIEVGESSGNLPFVLDKLADHLDMRMDFERRIKSALIYPVILMMAALIAVFIFFKFILPNFATIFKDFDIKLPAPTQFLFAVSEFVNNNFLLVVGVAALCIVGMYLFITRPETKEVRDRISFKLPLVGEMFFLFSLDRFTSTMHILLESGLPLVYALEISARGIGNSQLEKNVLFVKDRVKDGAALSREFNKLNLFPALISEMAKIGEETGSMPEIFKKISAHYSKELSTRIERLVVAFEPIMILVIGVVIGGIVISLFLPLFKISTLGTGG